MILPWQGWHTGTQTNPPKSKAKCGRYVGLGPLKREQRFRPVSACRSRSTVRFGQLGRTVHLLLVQCQRRILFLFLFFSVSFLFLFFFFSFSFLFFVYFLFKVGLAPCLLEHHEAIHDGLDDLPLQCQ
jgi:hypothetical protein